MIWRISESQASLLIGDRVRAADDMQVTWADTSLARQYLDWKPVVDLEKGLRMTIEWAQERESQDETRFVTR
jgi:nucleoside-diphosphate-sugar epimerase